MRKAANVVITGSTRGIGHALAMEFLKSGCRVMITGRSRKNLDKAGKEFAEFGDRVLFSQCDVCSHSDVVLLWQSTINKWKTIDIWINNAGQGQPDMPAWDIPPERAAEVVHTNITGTVFGTRVAMKGMMAQGFGKIFNMEGFGSDGRHMSGLTLYGTTKCAVRYFTEGVALEAGKTGVLVGTISPGMVVTDFILGPIAHNPVRVKQFVKIVNIIADLPQTVARFLVPRMLENKKQGARISWLTGRKLFWRFMTFWITRRKLVDADFVLAGGS